MLSRTARSLLRPSTTLRTIPHQRPSPRQLSRFLHPITSRRHFHASPQTHKGLQPDSSDPEPPKSHAGDGAVHVTEPANITAEEYHEIADEYIDELVSILEEKAEAAGSGYDTEYSVRHPIYPGSILSTLMLTHAGWCTDSQHTSRHLCPEQATPKQADLDFVAHIRTEEI